MCFRYVSSLVTYLPPVFNDDNAIGDYSTGLQECLCRCVYMREEVRVWVHADKHVTGRLHIVA